MIKSPTMKSLQLAVLGFGAFALSGCVASGGLKKDLYAGQAQAETSRARVALIRQPGPPERLVHKELPWASADIDLSAYPNGVAAMLHSLYGQVTVSTTAAQAQGADWLVTMSSDYPATVGLTFRDASGREIAEFSQPGFAVTDSPDADSLLAKILTPPAMIVSFGAMGFGFMYRAEQAKDDISAQVSKATSGALEVLRARIAATPALMPARVLPSTSPQPESRTCITALADPQAPPEVQLVCASAAEQARAWGRAVAHLRAYLEARRNGPRAAELRARISELEARP